ncbi:hypothetical protein L198_02867 [Cryptococcus wingfieldii CBS 7118]|uniref:Uncharacterized protein n=1 Tax=Cryptococcus wingfieldii CBS 7118 TaxID=1295528 RepID=A0A1E3JI75_9TREE|nr:hypothetical protein L198_02867 [Cryptococcus wingfieldii CBS 7118]ODO00548.1 hypothetical protein L198_02867 [Cryptococcus wingfieldii CBS 7118]
MVQRIIFDTHSALQGFQRLQEALEAMPIVPEGGNPDFGLPRVNVRLFPGLQWLVITEDVAQAPHLSGADRVNLVFDPIRDLLPLNLCYTEACSSDEADWLTDQLGEALAYPNLKLKSPSLHSSNLEHEFDITIEPRRYYYRNFMESLFLDDFGWDDFGSPNPPFPSQSVKLYNCDVPREEWFPSASRIGLTEEEIERIEMYTTAETASPINLDIRLCPNPRCSRVPSQPSERTMLDVKDETGESGLQRASVEPRFRGCARSPGRRAVSLGP